MSKLTITLDKIPNLDGLSSSFSLYSHNHVLMSTIQRRPTPSLHCTRTPFLEGHVPPITFHTLCSCIAATKQPLCGWQAVVNPLKRAEYIIHYYRNQRPFLCYVFIVIFVIYDECCSDFNHASFLKRRTMPSRIPIHPFVSPPDTQPVGIRSRHFATLSHPLAYGRVSNPSRYQISLYMSLGHHRVRIER